MVRSKSVEVQRGESLDVALMYPERDNSTTVEIDLVDVRAAARVRVWFDFDANAWVLEQKVLAYGAELCEWRQIARTQAFHPEETAAELPDQVGYSGPPGTEVGK